VHFDDRFTDGETEAEPFVPHFELLEGIENLLEKGRFDPDTGIGEIDDDVMLGVIACADAELAAGGSKFDRILDDVPKNLLQAGGIGPAMMFFGGEILLNFYLLFVQIGGRNSERVTERSVHVDGIVTQLEFAVGDAGEIEEIVDEQSFELDIAPEHFQIASCAIWNVMIALKRGDGHEHGRKRRAQFVGEHGEELVLRAICVLSVLFRFFERVFGMFAFCDFENGTEESRRPAGVVEEDAPFFLQPAFL